MEVRLSHCLGDVQAPLGAQFPSLRPYLGVTDPLFTYTEVRDARDDTFPNPE